MLKSNNSGKSKKHFLTTKMQRFVAVKLDNQFVSVGYCY